MYARSLYKPGHLQVSPQTHQNPNQSEPLTLALNFLRTQTNQGFTAMSHPKNQETPWSASVESTVFAQWKYPVFCPHEKASGLTGDPRVHATRSVLEPHDGRRRNEAVSSLAVSDWGPFSDVER